ncbi:hypothetical protein JAAARDRAFT_651209 [Jaapia argillacea MUCL 33604]|uniref:Uncharacterized protein n=1 Tax=Jaapia argillacea MUCL 33604 TaxID=933084 RepID=A0A067Q8X2_9AGAM|nr:hypothetical protein JAAARDRAFT_651209 [Jaapia argillacea MUCL 33604]
MVDQVFLDLPAVQGDDCIPQGKGLEADEVADSSHEEDCPCPTSPIPLDAHNTPTNPSDPAAKILLSSPLARTPIGTPKSPSLQCPDDEPVRSSSQAPFSDPCLSPPTSAPPSVVPLPDPLFADMPPPSGWSLHTMPERPAPPAEEEEDWCGWGAPKTKKKKGGKGGGKKVKKVSLTAPMETVMGDSNVVVV